MMLEGASKMPPGEPPISLFYGFSDGITNHRRAKVVRLAGALADRGYCSLEVMSRTKQNKTKTGLNWKFGMDCHCTS